ncbi:MAG: sigma-70 family RNA polymerase sigma factor [Isosphaeraceae bacterium]
MTNPTHSSWRRDLQTIFNSGTLAGLSDGQLLERIASRRGMGEEGNLEVESAFALLIERHGPMVLRVCRSVLRDPHEADDAFQATFLILLRRAASIRKRDSVGPWLHGVAHRVAAGARSAEARRRSHERRWFERRQEAMPPRGVDPHEFDLSSTIHAELDRLPERYRAPIVLCDLEERSLDEAARQLGWPLGTVKSRLNRGRQRLRDRLVRRGVAPATAGLVLSGSGLIQPAEAAVAVSLALARTTCELIRSGATLAWGSSASVLALARRVPGTAIAGKLKTTGLVMVLLGLSALGIGYLASILPLVNPGDQAGAPRAPTPPELATQAGEARTADDAPEDPPRPFEPYLESVDISGRATGPGGQPVAGATVYVIDWKDPRPGANYGRSRLLTTLTTGQDGRFIARGVELSATPRSGRSGVAMGQFQVAATAPGFGLTWHEVNRVRPAERRPSTSTYLTAMEPETFYQGEPIRVDLALDLPATVRGRLVDDLGRPLAGVEVRFGIRDNIRQLGGDTTWSCVRLDPTDAIPEGRRDFPYIASLPEAIRSARTRPDGTYWIDGLPREAQFFCAINPGPDYEPANPTIATTTRALPDVRGLGHDAVLDHRFLAPRDVRLAVRYSDTDRPARNATVRARSERTMLGTGSVGAADDEGRVTLHLRPGEYELAIEPPLDAPYRPGRKIIEIGREQVAEITDLKLEPAALVTLEAVDAKTGAGIEGVRFQFETDASHERRDLPSQLVIVDHPVTDDRGRLRAIVEPGRRRFFVESAPPGWKFEGTTGTRLDLAAGQETTARFAFARDEGPAANGSAQGDSSAFPEDLVDKWRRQQRATRTGKFHIRSHVIGGTGSVPRAELDALLDRVGPGEPAALAAKIRARFLEREGPDMNSHEIVVDAGRRRDMRRARNNFILATYINNAKESINQEGMGAEILDAKDVGLYYLGFPDFTYWPPLGGRPARSDAEPGGVPAIRRTEGPHGRLAIESETETARARWVVDRTSGFVHAYSWITRPSRLSQVASQEVRQYGPKVFADGAVLPTVHVGAQLFGDRVDYLVIKIIDEVDLAYRPGPLDFVLAVPSRTLIVDKRKGRKTPNQGIAHYPVADVAAFADEMASRYRSIEPVLKPGQPAPSIEPAEWFDRNGPAGAPDLAGKVVLVHFWGNTCAPCMAELTEVQAAADRFAGRGGDLVLIGLHNSGPSAGHGAPLARKQGLTYRLAIDRPADEEGWPGATFRSYGVRPLAIPAAAVIDRQGMVAFVGPFREALQKAEDLIGR